MPHTTPTDSPHGQLSCSPKPPRVRIDSVRLLPEGNLKAFVSVQIGPLIIADFRVIQQPAQSAYVAPPQAEYSRADGTRGFKPLLSYPDSWKAAINEAVFIAYDAAREKAGGIG